MHLNSKLNKIILITILSGIMASCNSKNKNTEEEKEEEVSLTVVSLTKRQIKLIDLKTDLLTEKELLITIPVTGKINLLPQDRADVTPLIGGIIQSINVIEGDKVKKGSVLATIAHPNIIQLQEEYVNTITNYQYLKKNYERQKELNNKNVGSKKEYEKSESKYNAIKSNVKALEIKLTMLGINAKKVAAGIFYETLNLTAPISGTISLVNTKLGSFTSPNETVFKIINNNNLYVDVTIFQKDIEKVHINQKLTFSASGNENELFEATIFAMSPNIEISRKGRHIYAKIEKKIDMLFPGMYIKGNIVIEKLKTLAVPEHALVEQDGFSYIFIKSEIDEGTDTDDDNEKESEEEQFSFIKTEVITSKENSDYVQIKLLSPLPKNTIIVSYGAYYLLAEMGKGEVEDDD